MTKGDSDVLYEVPPKRRLKVDLSELEGAFELHGAMGNYLDLETGHVVTVTDEISRELESITEELDELDKPLEDALRDRNMPEWWREALLEADLVDREFGDRFIRIPTIESHDAFDDMVQFTSTASNGRARRALEDALSRNRPFRRFKDALHGYPDIQERWYAFSADAMRRRVLEWLADEGIEPI